MKSAGTSSPNHLQEPYIRTRESPFFDDLLRPDDNPLRFNSHARSNSSSNVFISAPHIIGETTTPKIIVSQDNVKDLSLQNSAKHVENGCNEEHWVLQSSAKANRKEKTYNVTRRKEKLSSILLPLSAAAYFNGVSPEMEIVESCESINNLNAYLKARKGDVNAGVPGKFLHAVITSDAADVGTVASTILYSFYLNVTLKGEFCTVPIININRANLGSRVELKWLLDSCQIDQSSLVFADEIDLSYYDLFGSLKIVLLKSTRIGNKQEKLKHAVVEIFHSKKGSSCCTAIAEKFATYSPEILACKSFSQLLLAGILLDTGNLKDPQCTSKDKYMTSLLINGAGRYGCNGLYQLLRYKMHDLSCLQVTDILRKDFKKWTGQESGDSRSVSQIGMSCVGISIGQLVAQAKNLAQEITYFQSLEKLRALIVVSGFYNEEKSFKLRSRDEPFRLLNFAQQFACMRTNQREVLISMESVKLLESLLFFFDFNASRLPLKSLHLPGLKNEMKAFEIEKITSRKTIEHLIQEFIGIPKV